jgi:hypothetical protein
MCKVRIVNKSNNYSVLNNTTIEADIPSDVVPVIKQIFTELNNQRTNACMPSISIEKL